MSKVKQFLLLFLLNFCSCLGDTEGQLKAVFVLFRDGDRSPLSTWPNDKYYPDSSLWPDGYGELNNIGKERLFILGQWFRQRYDDFLPARYNRSDIFIRTSNIDRALMSAEYYLAGLYPPTGDQVWKAYIPWQAIPVHTVPKSSDPILTTSISCSKHSKLEKKLLKQKEFTNLDKENAELYKKLSELTGYSDVDLSTFTSLYGGITIYRSLGFSLPDWTDTYWSDISRLAALKMQIATYTTDLAKLRSGPFFNYLLDFLQATTEHTSFASEDLSAAPKFLLLGSHESILAGATNSMGAFPGVVPQFGSAVVWEVRSKSEKDFYLNIYYKNSTDFTPLTVDGCDFDCSVTKFNKIMSSVAVTAEKWAKQCKDDD